MRRCPKCNNEVDNDLIMCPDCNENTIESPELKPKSNKKNLFSSKKVKILFILVITSLFTTGAIFSARYFYKQHRQRYLKEANAYLELGDKESALPLYEKHLLINPKDTRNKSEYAHLLSELGQKEKALDVFNAILKSDYANDRRERDIKLLSQAFMFLLYEELIIERTEHARNALKQTKYEEAREYYLLTSKIIYKSMEARGWVSKSISEMSEDDSYGYLRFFNQHERIKAEHVFSFWLEGNREIAYDITKNWYIPDFEFIDSLDFFWDEKKFKDIQALDSNYFFAKLLTDEANKYFDEDNWNLAIEGFNKAYEYFEQSKSNSSGSASECLYNCAFAYLKKGSHASARRTLNILKRKYPDYETKKVNQMINVSVEASSFDVANNHLNDASDYFDKDNWISARVSFYKAINSYLKAGVADSNDLIGETRLNIAYTYFNEDNFQKAKEILLEIQKKNPKYEPMVIKETLKEVNSILRKTI